MNRREIIIGIAALALAATTVAALTAWLAERQHTGQLEEQLAELRAEEKRSAVVRSVSKQMEEIAYQQKDISDEQRIEALAQTKLAYEERQKALASEQQARLSEQRALNSEHQAQDARQTAEKQRLMADQQRQQAEEARSTADTLRYRALGQSLGSMSVAQNETGNKETADLLAYASYLFTDRYKGDLYNYSVLKALTMASQSQHSWPVHNGAVTAITFARNSSTELVSVSNYGEVVLHHVDGDHLRSTTLLRNNQYDFRSVLIDSVGTIYAASRSGHLLSISKNGQCKAVATSGVTHPQSFDLLEDKNIIAVVGDRSMAFFDAQTFQQTSVRQIDATITCVGRRNGLPLLFDSEGHMHQIVSPDIITTEKMPVTGHVTAYAISNTSKYEAYGMNDGTIYTVSPKGRVNKLVGHRSRISQLKFDGYKLYSSSYDGTVNLWLLNNHQHDKIDPMLLLTADNWITFVTFDQEQQHMWTGDQHGNLTKTLISIPDMVEKMRSQLKRDLTEEEWNYYIGYGVPRESFLNKEKKGGKP